MLINSIKLKFERDSLVNRSKLLSSYKPNHSSAKPKGPLQGNLTSIGNERKQNKILWREKASGRQRITSKSKNSKKRTIDQVFNDNAEADGLIKSYRLQRGPRGTLIPIKPSPPMKRDAQDDLIAKGSKRRKNKKKQNRDNVVREFCNNFIEL